MCGLKSSGSGEDPLMGCCCDQGKELSDPSEMWKFLMRFLTVRFSGRTVLSLVDFKRKYEHFQKLESYLVLPLFDGLHIKEKCFDIKINFILNYDYISEFVGSNGIPSLKWFRSFIQYP